MSYVYIQTEPRLWTVGFYAPDGSWHTDTDHGSKQEAAAQVRYLNGGELSPYYEGAIRIAVNALRDGYDPEYRRGVVNVIAELFPVIEQTVDERMTTVSASIDAALTPGGEVTEAERMYDVADDYETATLDALRQRAGITWDHTEEQGCDPGGWTNLASDSVCQRCGKPRTAPGGEA